MSKLEQLIQELCPNGVEWKKLGDLGDFENTGVDKKTIEGQPLVNLLNYVDVYKHMYIDNEIPNMVVSAPEKKVINCNCLEGDIFITPSSETKDDIGHAAVVTETLENTVYSYHIMRFRLAKLNLTTSFYIRYLFETQIVQSQIIKYAKGLTRYGLSKYDFSKIEIPLPPLPVQEEIVRILDAFTSHAAELQAELQARREQYEYYRNTLLSLEGDSSVEWKKLGDIAFIPNERISTNQIDKYVGVENLLKDKKGALPSDKVPESANAILYKCNDILIGNIRPYLKKIWLSDGFGGTNGDVVLIRVTNEYSNLIDNRYLYYLLSSDSFFEYDNQYAKGGKMPRGDKQKIMEYCLPIPTLSEQRRIVAILDKFEVLVNDLTEGLPAEIAARQEQYEYYRDKLLNFPKAV